MLVACVVVVGLGVGVTQWFKPSFAAQVAASTTLPTLENQGADPSVALSDTTAAQQMTDSMQSSDEQLERQTRQINELKQQLRRFQQQSGNIQAWLQDWNVQCGTVDCQRLLDAALAEYDDQRFAAQMQRLLNRLPAYEQAMQSMVMSTDVDPRQRYDKIWALREQVLGRDEARLGFGQERAFANYQFNYAALRAQASQLTPEQRLAALAQLQQQAQQQYPEVLTETEGQAGQYEKARELLLAGVTDPLQQQQITQQLRQQYFSVEVAAQMAQRDQQVEQQQAQVNQYQQAVKKLQQDMAQQKQQLSSIAWQQQYEVRLAQLRQQHFP